MLTVKQIRNLVKTAPPLKMSRFEIKRTQTFWTNGRILFFEPCPEKKSGYAIDAPGRDVAHVANLLLRASKPVYPVEMQGNLNGVSIRFTDGQTSAWFEGRSVSEFVKRAGKSPLRYLLGDNGTPYLAIHNERPLGLLSSLDCEPVSDPDWNFRFVGD